MLILVFRGSADIPKPCMYSSDLVTASWQPGTVEEGVYLSTCKVFDVACP